MVVVVTRRIEPEIEISTTTADFCSCNLSKNGGGGRFFGRGRYIQWCIDLRRVAICGRIHHNTYIVSIQSICMDNITDDINTDIRETAKLLKEKVDMGDQRLRNLMLIRQSHLEYLERERDRTGWVFPGIPVVLKDGDLRLKYIHLFTLKFDRAYFERHPNGGTQIVPLSPFRGGEGYQWYILTWKWFSGKLNVFASHWMIDRDSDLKRNNVWFTRGFHFNELDETDLQERGARVYGHHIRLADIPDRHKRTTTGQAISHALRHDAERDTEEGWVTVTQPYGVFETIYNLNTLLRSFDTSEHQSWYLNQHFQLFWSLRVLEAVWGKEWSTKKFDIDGILKDLWYVPDTTHILDKEQFERIKAEWEQVREQYTEWLNTFRDPPHKQAPPPSDTQADT